MPSFEQVKKIKAKHENELLDKENVVGVGIGKISKTGELCIKVYVIRKIPESQLKPNEIIPEMIEGVRTDVIESGKIRFQNTAQ